MYSIPTPSQNIIRSIVTFLAPSNSEVMCPLYHNKFKGVVTYLSHIYRLFMRVITSLLLRLLA